jgi:hypothetical protein
MTSIDRILLLLTSLLTGYQVAVGINGLDTVPIIAYTIGFGVLLVAALLMIILGFEVLDLPIVVIISTVIPLSLALGLIWEHAASYGTLYLLFALIGFLAVTVTRSIPMKNKIPTILLAIVHGIAGMTIFLLPSIMAASGTMKSGFALVGLGGALMGLGGLLLSFLKAGRPVLSKETILRVLPALLLLMTGCFVAGFRYG